MKTLLTLILTTASLHAQTFSWNEAVNGDLSNDYLVPTPLTAGLGNNTLIGSLSGGGGDRDLLTFTVPSGMQWSGLILNGYTTGGAATNVSFMGAQAGSNLSQAPSNAFSDPIGYVLYGNWAVGKNILPTIVNGPPFNNQNPLPAGDYALWIQETGASSTYNLNFVIIAVPEASTSMLGVLGVTSIFLRRKRMSNKS